MQPSLEFCPCTSVFAELNLLIVELMEIMMCIVMSEGDVMNVSRLGGIFIN